MSIIQEEKTLLSRETKELEHILSNLQKENLILKSDLGYWKRQHERARKREEEIKKELQDKNARMLQLLKIIVKAIAL